MRVCPAPRRAPASVMPTASTNCTSPSRRSTGTPAAIRSALQENSPMTAPGTRKKTTPMDPMKATARPTPTRAARLAPRGSPRPRACPTMVWIAAPIPKPGMNDSDATRSATLPAATARVEIRPRIKKKIRMASRLPRVCTAGGQAMRRNGPSSRGWKLLRHSRRKRRRGPLRRAINGDHQRGGHRAERRGQGRTADAHGRRSEPAEYQHPVQHDVQHVHADAHAHADARQPTPSNIALTTKKNSSGTALG